MSLLRILSYFRGYVVIVVEGKQIEKFINMAVSKGYNLWEISQPRDNVMIAKVDLFVYPFLRHVARGCRCKMRIHRKRGLPFAAARIKKRKMLIVGAVFFIVSLYILSSFVWFVEVVSSRELKMVSKQQVLDAAAEYGIRRGALRFTIDNNQVGDALEKKFTEISWVGVEVRGTKVVIEVVEKVFPREGAEKKSPGNIVACKDGIVKELLVLSGEPKVAAGDTVRKGDILISGVIYPQDSSDEPEGTVQDNSNSEEQQRQSGQPVHVGARGIVRARVWYESRVQIPLLQHKEELTGKSRRVFVLRLGEKKILLKNEWEKDFQRYRREEDVKKLAIGKFAVPVDLLIVNYKEIEKKDIYHNMAEARKMAEEIAAKDMTSRLPEGAKVVSRKTDVSSADEKELKAVVYMETLENIAKFVPLE